jgi:hypothetical protein
MRKYRSLLLIGILALATNALLAQGRASVMGLEGQYRKKGSNPYGADVMEPPTGSLPHLGGKTGGYVFQGTVAGVFGATCVSLLGSCTAYFKLPPAKGTSCKCLGPAGTYISGITLDDLNK